MKSLSQITFGFSDAENYRKRENKVLFERIFLKTDALDQILKSSTYFLIGEKGTGKTAYAVHLTNNKKAGYHCFHKFIRETDYQKFIFLKKSKNLNISEYIDIWKCLILLLTAKEISDGKNIIKRISSGWKFSAVEKAIDNYYESAFSPEIPSALKFVEDSKVSAKLLAKYITMEAEATGEMQVEATENFTRFQTSLLYIEKALSEAISAIKLTEDYILFIDGIDIRPENIQYGEYLDCVKGLANAVWSLNNDLFPNIRDSKGKVKIMLLLRPDIFSSLGLVNRNTKLKDNSVTLGWYAPYPAHRESDLFRMADRMFSAQQDERYSIGKCWDGYFPFDAANIDKNVEGYSSFIAFLRQSLHRPRDILTMLDILHDVFVKKGVRNEYFKFEDLSHQEVRASYSAYFLGEIRDSLSFYYTPQEFENFLSFFDQLNGKFKFSYDQFVEAFEEAGALILGRDEDLPEFMRSADEFLQFLYDLNVLAYIEQGDGERFIRWCFIERTHANISPKVKIGVDYEIHYALTRALNLGMEVRKRKAKLTERKAFSGVILRYIEAKGFGFLKVEGIPMEVFFHKSAIKAGMKVYDGLRVRVVLDADGVGRIRAKSVTSA